MRTLRRLLPIELAQPAQARAEAGGGAGPKGQVGADIAARKAEDIAARTAAATSTAESRMRILLANNGDVIPPLRPFGRGGPFFQRQPSA